MLVEGEQKLREERNQTGLDVEPVLDVCRPLFRPFTVKLRGGERLGWSHGMRSQFLYLSLPSLSPPPKQVKMIMNVLCGQTINKNNNNKKDLFFFHQSLSKEQKRTQSTNVNCNDKQRKKQ